MSKGNCSPGASSGADPVLVTRAVRLPFGWAAAAVAGDRLLAVAWEEREDALRRATGAQYPGARTIDARATPAGIYLLAYAEGAAVAGPADAGVPIAWERVAEFDRAILRATAGIPYGRTIAYGDLAGLAGRPGAARAAGAALGRNPWPLIVPCHRVVGARGDLVGFGKGTEAKSILLRFESGNVARAALRRAQ